MCRKGLAHHGRPEEGAEGRSMCRVYANPFWGEGDWSTQIWREQCLHESRGSSTDSPHPPPVRDPVLPRPGWFGASSKFPHPEPPDLVPCPSTALVSQGGYQVTTDRTSLHLGQGLACPVNPQPMAAAGLCVVPWVRPSSYRMGKGPWVDRSHCWLLCRRTGPAPWTEPRRAGPCAPRTCPWLTLFPTPVQPSLALDSWQGIRES